MKRQPINCHMANAVCVNRQLRIPLRHSPQSISLQYEGRSEGYFRRRRESIVAFGVSC
jgi:hypothetical protein